MKRFLLLLAMLFCVNASAQYLDHRTCADGAGWAVNSVGEEKAFRNYGVIDANGECEWFYYNAKNASHSYVVVSKPRAKSVITVNGVMQFVPGTATTPPPVVTPPPVTPPPTVVPKHYKVAVVVLRWQSPPAGSGQATIDAFNASLPNVTTANVTNAMAQVAAWYAKETYGRMVLDVTVFPSVDLPGNPGCTYPFDQLNNIVGTQQFDQYIITSTYTCWQYHGSTWPGMIDAYPGHAFVHHIWAYEPGTLAHELGHAFGLYHAGSMIAPATTVTEYGNFIDQMGRGGSYVGLAHLQAHHKHLLKSLTPLSCVSSTLRSIYLYPDALLCGGYYVEYMDDWQQVWITKVAFSSGGGGGDDNYTVARLSAGQSWTNGTTTVKHVVGGQVVVTP